jgi:hypothetical protein
MYLPFDSSGAFCLSEKTKYEFGHTLPSLRDNSGVSISEGRARVALLVQTSCQTRSAGDVIEKKLNRGRLLQESCVRRRRRWVRTTHARQRNNAGAADEAVLRDRRLEVIFVTPPRARPRKEQCPAAGKQRRAAGGTNRARRYASVGALFLRRY